METLKYIICIFISFLFFTPAGTEAVPPAGSGTFEYEQNLLVNGDFEQGLQHPWGTGQYSEARPIWWNSSSCNSKALATTKAAHSGSASLLIDNPSSRSPHVFGTTAQRIDIRPEQRYRLVLWAGARDLASNGAVNFAVDQQWQIRPVSLPAGSFPWTWFDGMFSLPGGFADVRIISEDKGKVWLDDIQVVPDLNLSIHGSEGSAWSGREGDGWDFVLYQPVIEAEKSVLYRYAAQHARSGRIRSGQMRVTIFGNHLKAELLDSAGQVRRGYDGTLSDDGTIAWGSSWPRPESSPAGPERYGWWATIEKRLPFAAPASIDLNHATVAQLEALGLSGRSARTLVEGRVLGGPYRSVQEATGAPGLMVQERKIVEGRCLVQ